MKIKQISTILNQITAEMLGTEENIVKEDLTNIVDVGKQLKTADDTNVLLPSLIDKVARVWVDSRTYKGRITSLNRTDDEWGSILQRITFELPETSDNESWGLVDGTEYAPIYREPKVNSKLFNKYTTFDVEMSFTQDQLYSAFNSVDEFNAFVSGIYNAIENKFRLCIESLSLRTINNFISATLFDEIPEGNYAEHTGVKAVNLLKLYKTVKGDNTLTVDNALLSTDFLKFASTTLAEYVDYLHEYSTLFNIEGKERFTNEENLCAVMLSAFAKHCDSYLQSDTFHNEYTALVKHDTVAKWQYTKSLEFKDLSQISTIFEDANKEKHEISINGVVAVLYDKYACGIHRDRRRVDYDHSGRGGFNTYYYKENAMYYNDFSENFVVFFIQ